jgi:hypothetical protein
MTRGSRGGGVKIASAPIAASSCAAVSIFFAFSVPTKRKNACRSSPPGAALGGVAEGGFYRLRPVASQLGQRLVG